MWLAGFALMMASFSFLFSSADDQPRPRISVEPWWPEQSRRRR
jgi:hypothetical protein